MKTIKKIINLFVLGVLVSLTSCNNINLDATPIDNVATDEVIKSIDAAKSSARGMYDRLSSSNYYGRNYLITGDLSADNTLVKPTNSGRFLSEYNLTLTKASGNSANLWLTAYRAINAANVILRDINNVTDGTAEEKNDVMGQAYAVRALAHFDLVKMFAFPYNVTDATVAPGANGQGGNLGVPLMLAPVEDPATSFPARNTVSEVYDQVIADLKLAEGLLANTRNNLDGTFNKIAVQAILSRVYLYKEDNANAIVYADKVINSGMYTLVSNAGYLTSWDAIVDGTNSEMILQIIATPSDNVGFDALASMYVDEGYGDIIPIEDLKNLYGVNDIRKGWLRNIGGLDYTYKFPERFWNNIPLVRLSEVYLNKAEAAAKLGQDAVARMALDAVALRADASLAPNNDSGVVLINKILEERRKELAYEGHRLFDLVRNKMDIVRVDTSSPAVPANITYPSTNMIWPIPEDETNRNENMVQNQGY